MTCVCLLYEPGRACPCRVLADANASASALQPMERLRQQYCESGRFIVCPVFMHIQRKLASTHRRLRQMAGSSRRSSAA